MIGSAGRTHMGSARPGEGVHAGRFRRQAHPDEPRRALIREPKKSELADGDRGHRISRGEYFAKAVSQG